jgi:hypothetical protein
VGLELVLVAGLEAMQEEADQAAQMVLHMNNILSRTSLQRKCSKNFSGQKIHSRKCSAVWVVGKEVESVDLKE